MCEVFPWVAFLSRDEVQEFVAELMSTRAVDSIDNPAAVIQVIENWRATPRRCSPIRNWLRSC